MWVNITSYSLPRCTSDFSPMAGRRPVASADHYSPPGRKSMHEKGRGHAPKELAEGQSNADTPRYRWGRHLHLRHTWLRVRLGGDSQKNEVRRELQASYPVRTALRQARWMITTLEHITSLDNGGGQNRAIITAPTPLTTLCSLGEGGHHGYASPSASGPRCLLELLCLIW